MAKRGRLYKTVNVATKDMGSAGGQILLGEIKKVDAQGITGFLNNVRLSIILDDATISSVAFLAYLTTDDAWNDDYVLSACAGDFGHTCSLSGKRVIKTAADTETEQLGMNGPIYLWAEISDPGVSAYNIRYVAEVWGRFVKYVER